MKAGFYLLLFCATLHAQWVNLPIPGTPRTPDGKPNLSAPVPRTAEGKPDLSGLWGVNPGNYGANVAADLKPEDIQPWAADLVKQRAANIGRDHPSAVGCLPHGPSVNTISFLMQKFIQTPNVLVILLEELNYRQIHLDGRALPKAPDPSFMGYSVGRWEGDTLIAESTGFKDRIWLDLAGHPITDSLHITERFHRLDFGHMEIAETIDDPKTFKKPFTIVIRLELVPDSEILEFVCAENEKDREHMVGTPSDPKPAAGKVAPAVLSRYVGSYEFAYPENPTVTGTYNITMSEGALFIDTEGKARTALIPVSDTVLYWRDARLEFFEDSQGKVTHFVRVGVEGDLRYTRKPDHK